jgi:hypothetical protein
VPHSRLLLANAAIASMLSTEKAAAIRKRKRRKGQKDG